MQKQGVAIACFTSAPAALREGLSLGSLPGKHPPLHGATPVRARGGTLGADGGVKKTCGGWGWGQSGDVSSVKITFRVCLWITVCVLQAMHLPVVALRTRMLQALETFLLTGF